MRALTLIQPWATAILTLGKDVENRKWAPGRKLIKIGERFAIHAGKKIDKAAYDDLVLNVIGPVEMPVPSELPTGVILGSVELAAISGEWVDDDGPAELCMSARKSPWAVQGSPAWWVLRNPRLLATPIPCKGALGLWTVPEQYLAALEAL
jgi:hypothetical protein